MTEANKRIAIIWGIGLLGISILLASYTFSGSGKGVTERVLTGQRYANLLTPAVARQLPPKDNAYLVNFWATWCAPCRAEHSVLVDMADAGVTIVGINADSVSNRGAVKRWLEELGDPFATQIYDDDGSISVQSGLRGYPTSLVIDGEGQIVTIVEGAITPNLWKEKLKPHLVNLDGEP